MNVTMRLPAAMDSAVQTNITPSATARFKVLPKVEFVPAYDWRRVEEWQDVMSGLDVKMPIGGADFRKARIPQTWRLQAWVVDDAGKKPGSGAFARIEIGRKQSLLSVR